MTLQPLPRCRECKAEMVYTPTRTALVCPTSPEHPMRVVITEATREAFSDQDWALLTDFTRTHTGPVNWAKSK